MSDDPKDNFIEPDDATLPSVPKSINPPDLADLEPAGREGSGAYSVQTGVINQRALVIAAVL